MAVKLHACARAACGKLCPTKTKYCSTECLALAKAPVEALVVKGNTATLSKVVGERVRSLADLVRVCEIDPAEWEVVSYECNKWEMGAVLRAKDTPDLVTVTELFQVKAKMRRRVELVTARAEIEQMKLDAQDEQFASVKLRTPEPRHSSSKKMLEISIPDLHMGKLAWARETRQNYDHKIAAALFETALAKLLERSASWKIDQILFVVGNDLLHTDNPNGTTTRGTPQDTDGRFHKTFWKTREMVTRAIDHLRLIAPVMVLMVPGNHDTQTLWHLGDSLECWYRNAHDVFVDNQPTQRKYYQFGKVMLMHTHGDKGKKQDYPLLMATEEPKMFGETVHREAHTGHIHQLQVREQHGVRVRVSPALCAADAWHAENQYVGNARAAEAFVWDEEEGLMCQVTWTAPEGR